MMRYWTTHLALTLALAAAGLAGAATPAPECRSACVPRIAEQCGTRSGRAHRRCRRPLLRACRRTTPDLGCPSTGDLTRALGDRLLTFSTDDVLHLCADGTFAQTPPHLVSPRPTPTPTPPAPVPAGLWSVVVDGDGLALDLGAGTTRERRISIAPTADGFLVDGASVADSDATAACAAGTVPAPPVPTGPLPDPARALAVARAVTDRLLTVDGVDAAGSPQEQDLTLCSSGGARVATIDGGVGRSDSGTWTVDDTGTSIELSLAAGLAQSSFGVDVLADGTIRVNGTTATVSDARGFCALIDLQTRLTALLPGSVYAIPEPQGALQTDSTLAFCDATRFAIRTLGSVVTTGTWSTDIVEIPGEIEVTLSTGANGGRTAILSFDTDGTVLLDGRRPVVNPTLALRFVCS
jgi:hypothetical protein